MIRAFLALPLPPEAQKSLGILQKKLSASDKIRWLRPQGLHITLFFLGEMKEERFEEVKTAILAPFQVGGPPALRLEGLGAFPSPQKARVVWTAIGGDAGKVQKLYGLVRQRLAPLGFEAEKRPFAAHVTIGRSKSRGGFPDLEAILEKNKNFSGPEWVAGELVLYTSVLQPGGAVYTPRAFAEIA